MQPTTFLQLSNPCNENWHNMTATEKGRFCNACKEQVIDFTSMTDRQVLAYLNSNQGKICGRIYTHQLNRALVSYNQKPSFGLQWILTGLSALFFSVVKSQPPTVALQEKPRASFLTNTAVDAKTIEHNIVTVRGSILNQEQQAILNAYVTGFSDNDKIFTNKKGEFVLQVPANVKSLLVSAEGYHSRVVPTSLLQEQDTTIVLTAVDTGIGGLDKNHLDKNIIMGGITTFTEIEKPDTVITFVKKVFNNQFFKIQPNPANKNGVNISISKTGVYTVQIFDNNSRLLYTQEVVVNHKGQVVFINFNGCVTKGTYYIRVIDKQSKKQYTDKLMVQ